MAQRPAYDDLFDRVVGAFVCIIIIFSKTVTCVSKV